MKLLHCLEIIAICYFETVGQKYYLMKKKTFMLQNVAKFVKQIKIVSHEKDWSKKMTFLFQFCSIFLRDPNGLIRANLFLLDPRFTMLRHATRWWPALLNFSSQYHTKMTYLSCIILFLFKPEPIFYIGRCIPALNKCFICLRKIKAINR